MRNSALMSLSSINKDLQEMENGVVAARIALEQSQKIGMLYLLKEILNVVEAREQVQYPNLCSG